MSFLVEGMEVADENTAGDDNATDDTGSNDMGCGSGNRGTVVEANDELSEFVAGETDDDADDIWLKRVLYNVEDVEEVDDMEVEVLSAFTLWFAGLPEFITRQTGECCSTEVLGPDPGTSDSSAGTEGNGLTTAVSFVEVTATVDGCGLRGNDEASLAAARDVLSFECSTSDESVEEGEAAIFSSEFNDAIMDCLISLLTAPDGNSLS